MIQTQKLHKYYNKGKNNEIHVINDTSISLPDTGLVCILGESGSGKTTLLNTLGGLDHYETGEITIAGERLRRYSQDKMDRIRTKHCGYIFQNYYLLPEHTVDYNIRLVLNMYDMSEEEKTKRIDYVLAAVDMMKYKKRRVSQLSGGQQQRVAIARALAKTPKIIFADEPTGNLDEANTLRVMHILKKVSQNCLVVMVTHELRLADVFADRVIKVDNGKIISDTAGEQTKEYQYQDDSIIYLQEYEHKSSTEGNISIHHYTDGESEEDLSGLTLRVIEENGRFYIQAISDAQVVLLQPNSKKQVLDEKRPKITQETPDEFAYELEELESKRMPKLSFGEILRVAMRNLSLLGKQQIFLVVSFLAMAILLVITVSDMLTLKSIDLRSVVESDSRYVEVKTEKNGGFSLLAYNEYFEDLLNDYLETTDLEYIRYNGNVDLYFYYEGFEQIQDVKAMLTGYSVANLEELSEQQLVAGSMPTRPNEVVIDTWVLKNFIDKEASLAQIFPTPESFVGRELSLARKQWNLVIVGVCDTGEPNIYMDKFSYMSVTDRMTYRMAGEEMLKQAYPESYADVSLAADEIMISEKQMQHLIDVKSNTKEVSVYGTTYHKVVGTFPDELGADYILSDEAYDDMLKYLVIESKSFIVTAEDKQSVFEYFGNLPESVTENLQIFVTDSYGDALSKYEEETSIKVDARMVITLTIFVISLVLLYFSMKSNAMKRIEDIKVYRLIGIQKRSILCIFATESFLLTCYTSLPAVIVTSGVLKFVASIPSLELTLVYPWTAAFGIMLFLFVINTITGILPIIHLVRKPAAHLEA